MSRTHAARQEAIALGLKRFDGNTCSGCGTTERYTNNGACCECNRRKCMEYYRQDKKKRMPPQHRGARGSERVLHHPAVKTGRDFIAPIPLSRLMAAR